MKIREIIHHLVFGLLISGIFGILGFMVLLFPIFFSNELIVIIPGVIGFIIFEVILFILGFTESIKYDKEQLEKIQES